MAITTKDKYEISITAKDQASKVIDNLIKSFSGISASVNKEISAVSKLNNAILQATQTKRLITIGLSKEQAQAQINQFKSNLDSLPLKKQVDLVVAKSGVDSAQLSRTNKIIQQTRKSLQEAIPKTGQFQSGFSAIGASVSETSKSLVDFNLQMAKSTGNTYNPKNDTDGSGYLKWLDSLKQYEPQYKKYLEYHQKNIQLTKQASDGYLNFAQGMQQPFRMLDTLLPGVGAKIQNITTGLFGLQTVM